MMQKKRDQRALKRVWQHSLLNNPENSFIKQWWFWVLVALVIGTIISTGQTPYDYAGLTSMFVGFFGLITLINGLIRWLRHKKIGVVLPILFGLCCVISLVAGILAKHFY
ncbi:hypothetical protein ACNAN0_02840 [Agrilactobacillus fermenti]|uniref:hypothetical protein n=1 Tax=Agrilactobacillus fermenti TaxID=2586909 RepID=UPI001E621002|nr:hypothetical protein [Agrilactobacillus fermenti]MCD2256345.1 hypothetical protein [Agrilactobacillus fermenti]